MLDQFDKKAKEASSVESIALPSRPFRLLHFTSEGILPGIGLTSSKIMDHIHPNLNAHGHAHAYDKDKGQMAHLPLGCVLDGPIPDPRHKKKPESQEKDHGPTYHAKYGGAMNFTWFTRLNLTPAVQKLMCYPESCLLVNEGGATVGKMYTSVTVTEWAHQPCLLVHCGSYAKLRTGMEVGTDLTGFISPDMKVLQELGHEWARVDGMTFDRKTFLMIEPDGRLFCQTVLRRDDEVKHDKVSFLEYGDLKTFVSEATNILLQRIIIQQKKMGDIDLKCLTMHGKVVKCNYSMLGNGYENVKGEDVKVWGIRRSVWIDHDVCSWDSLFNYYGRLVLRCQPENKFAMIPLWFRPVEDFDGAGHFIGLLPPLLWGCDPQLYSEFTIKKTKLTADYKKYLSEHPDLRAILSDFLQKLLLQRPRNVIEFAKSFFQPFALLKADETKPDEAAGSSSSSSSSFGGEFGGEGDGLGDLSYLYPLGLPPDGYLSFDDDEEEEAPDEEPEPQPEQTEESPEAPESTEPAEENAV